MTHSKQTRDAAIALYNTGLTAQAVGNLTGIRPHTIGQWVKQAGIARTTIVTDVTYRVAALDDLFASGDTLRVVAKRHGITHTTLRNWREEATDVDSNAYDGEWTRDGLVWRAKRSAA